MSRDVAGIARDVDTVSGDIAGISRDVDTVSSDVVGMSSNVCNRLRNINRLSKHDAHPMTNLGPFATPLDAIRMPPRYDANFQTVSKGNSNSFLSFTVGGESCVIS